MVTTKRKYAYSYIHIFTIGNPTFAKRFFDLLQTNDYFDINKHFFVIRLDNKYKNVSPFSNNVIFIYDQKIRIKKYYKQGKIVIIHNMTEHVLIDLNKKKLLERTIWRTWGSDLGIITPPQLNIDLKKIHHPRYYLNILKIYKRIRRLKYFIKYSLAFAGACIIDKINISIISNRKAFFYINYDGIELIEQKPRKVFLTTNNRVKIMVGHSGFSNEKHIKIIDKLITLNGFKRSIIIVPIVYGNEEYINQIKDKYANIPNVFLLEERYPDIEYNWILRNIDVAILGSNNSTGLGNICKLLKYKKTIYLSKEGIIAKGFENDKIPFYNIEDIDESIFLKHHHLKYDVSNSSIVYPSKQQIVERWKKMENYIENSIR